MWELFVFCGMRADFVNRFEKAFEINGFVSLLDLLIWTLVMASKHYYLTVDKIGLHAITSFANCDLPLELNVFSNSSKRVKI